MLAPIVSPTIGGVLLQRTSWQGIFVFLAALGTVIGAVVAYVWMPENLPPERRTGRGWRPVLASCAVLLRDRVMMSMVFVAGFMTGALAIAFGAIAVFFGVG